MPRAQGPFSPEVGRCACPGVPFAGDVGKLRSVSKGCATLRAAFLREFWGVQAARRVAGGAKPRSGKTVAPRTAKNGIPGRAFDLGGRASGCGRHRLARFRFHRPFPSNCSKTRVYDKGTGRASCGSRFARASCLYRAATRILASSEISTPNRKREARR